MLCLKVMTLNKRLGKQTVALETPPVIVSGAAIAGKKEGGGPIGSRFDQIDPDAVFCQICSQNRSQGTGSVDRDAHKPDHSPSA